MILRLSQKLNTKIKAGTLPALPRDENPLADWSARLFTAGRTQYVLLTNTQTLYSTVFYGKGNTDESQFIDRTLSSLRESMQADGHDYRRLIVPAAGTVHFAKALDRSVTGSMNDLVKFARLYLLEGELSLIDVGFKLNEIPMSSIARSRRETHGKPRAAFRALANVGEF